MKNIVIMLATLFLVGCANIENPKVSWGKKCTVQAHQVVYSYLWIYDKTKGLDANEENCAFIAD
jgi:PBP1b-binding outer membrane lipoprotein LpoB